MAYQVNDNLDIGSATMGISRTGLENYRKELRFNVIDKTKEELRNYKDIVDVIGTSWNGYSAQTFVNNFHSSIESACTGLDEISKAIDALFMGVENSIIHHDHDMIIEGDTAF